MQPKVTVYTQPSCAPCVVVKGTLRRAGVPYQEVTLTPELAEKFKGMGLNSTPIIESPTGVHDGKLWLTRRDKIEALGA